MNHTDIAPGSPTHLIGSHIAEVLPRQLEKNEYGELIRNNNAIAVNVFDKDNKLILLSPVFLTLIEKTRNEYLRLLQAKTDLKELYGTLGSEQASQALLSLQQKNLEAYSLSLNLDKVTIDGLPVALKFNTIQRSGGGSIRFSHLTHPNNGLISLEEIPRIAKDENTTHSTETLLDIAPAQIHAILKNHTQDYDLLCEIGSALIHYPDSIAASIYVGSKLQWHNNGLETLTGYSREVLARMSSENQLLSRLYPNPREQENIRLQTQSLGKNGRNNYIEEFQLKPRIGEVADVISSTQLVGYAANGEKITSRLLFKKEFKDAGTQFFEAYSAREDFGGFEFL